MIDEMKLVEAVWNKYNSRYNDATMYDADETKLINKVLGEIQRLIEEQPKVGEWIPCSERLPEFGEKVLCSLNPDNPTIIHLIIIATRTTDKYWYDGTIKAWMPLPEPFDMRKKVGT